VPLAKQAADRTTNPEIQKVNNGCVSFLMQHEEKWDGDGNDTR
jgi:hypothetical protein